MWALQNAVSAATSTTIAHQPLLTPSISLGHFIIITIYLFTKTEHNI
jgi:hypothetical protein